ncbi:NAD(P)-dependent oxidoreductase [Streptomyces sp. NBRC 109706]|uniref:NAD(P)-dependent oxidoreductase n=1 Tax=Streptomyces sp. NBRC 109706 TaxID=1550035 RepID=UPI000783D488|nr:NAD(P)H-binding protein [Streptomyces sp. NBRC 109706]
MRIAVLGATGGTGRQLVRQALAAGHQVTAVVRDRARIADASEISDTRALDIAEVPDQTQVAELAEAFAGQDAVLSALGTTGRQAGAVAAVTGAAQAAMAAAGVRRLVVVSAAPVGPMARGEGLAYRALLHPLISRVFRAVYRDLAAMEEELRGGGADWTVVRPPRLLDGPLTGVYRTALGANVLGGRTIARADLAHAMLAALDAEETVGQPLGVAY